MCVSKEFYTPTDEPCARTPESCEVASDFLARFPNLKSWKSASITQKPNAERHRFDIVGYPIMAQLKMRPHTHLHNPSQKKKTRTIPNSELQNASQWLSYYRTIDLAARRILFVLPKAEKIREVTLHWEVARESLFRQARKLFHNRITDDLSATRKKESVFSVFSHSPL